MNPVETVPAASAYSGKLENGVVALDEQHRALEGQVARSELPAEGEYRHLPLGTIDTRRVRYAEPVPLEPRHIVLDDLEDLDE